MVKIRLKRMGAHKKPFYRIVVADSRNARNGRFIEEIGHYDPLKEPPVIKVNGERAEYWLSQGAQPTEVVKSLLKKSGVGGEKPAAKVEAPAEVVEEAAEAQEEAVEETTEA
ncbi:MAG: 30S ribosomal protein S16 [Firmicutes bacterium]|nr:30S ribosomal protein S16 [Bacillota bacterium]